jgi:hypothetical protein
MRMWSWPTKAVAVALLAAASACAESGDHAVKTATSSAQRSCFRSEDVSGWSDVDQTTINLRVGVSDVYQLKLVAPCGELDFTSRIGLRSRGSNFICSGFDADIIAPTLIGPMTCPAASVRRLTADEVKALPDKQKP